MVVREGFKEAVNWAPHYHAGRRQSLGQIVRLIAALRKLVFHFLSNRMEYDRGDSFPLDFEPNEILFGLKLKRKLSLRSYLIQFERKWKHSFHPSLQLNALFFDVTTLKMARKPVKLMKENPAGCAAEGKQSKGK